MAFVDFIVEPEWLAHRLSSAPNDIRLIDASWTLPGTSAKTEHLCIEGSCYFDLDEIASPHPTLKHMLPSPSMFESYNRQNGIRNSDHIICYDGSAVFSSPRLWWTYRMFGHERVSVLNGRPERWAEKGLSLANAHKDAFSKSDYKVSEPLSGHITFEELLPLIGTDIQIIDARPLGRFTGADPEPRDGLRSGHIPGSISLPYNALRDENGLRDMSHVSKQVSEAQIDLSQPIITTCGSGITAAGLALLFHQLGAKDVRLYDGSWAEWGATDAPIVSANER